MGKPRVQHPSPRPLPQSRLRDFNNTGHEAASWKVSGFYTEARNCESICPCWTGHAPANGFCEGNCAWHVTEGKYGDIPLDRLLKMKVINGN